ncbi:peptidase C14 caspase catalytic subunit p20 [Catenulispora acidiphila DSM 44928]|uniref:Peptidase C14 caspase catalytic subunit p20 n=1 Tax=Catenulispora acidiphila (strain DSM 44928 / JCM 14897 / NBRC 102108 / NRRL B-24433 / ID139908) TaxID=479433 RepID=C7Q3L9_CATAD|nr:caspase family protein [Catenulispora acidiphila]ACU75784.1 peptidase C14 caspase catalytic subunit p20 [Catenulispora acidiphila DSM 44928]
MSEQASGPLRGRALLIGCAVDGLTGVDQDVKAVAEVLSDRSVEVEQLTGPGATRAAILDAYERLIAAVEPGDLAVVHYSGHGGLAVAPSHGPRPGLADLQFIVPVDFHDSKPGDFRGISSVELSVLQARLTAKTDNVVVVLDCCHSGQMSRDPGLRVRTTARGTPYERLREHIELQRRVAGLRTELRPSPGNPEAVRLVACAPDQSAFEYQGIDGGQIGVFTEALVLALRSAGTRPVSWASLLDAVRRRVQLLAPGQRPEAEGPSRRLLFGTKEDDPLDALYTVDIGSGRVRLDCAPLLGVRHGDTFEVRSAEDDRVGTLAIDVVGPLAAQGPLLLAPGVDGLPVGAHAHRTSTAAPALPVRVPSGGAAELEGAVGASPLLTVAGDDEPWAAQVVLDPDGRLTVGDRIGPLHGPYDAGPGGIGQAVRALVRIARATALRGLTADAAWAMGAELMVEWGLVRDGERHPLPSAGAALQAGDPMYIRIRNDDKRTVHVSLVNIGVDGAVTLLTDFAPSGIALAPDREYVFGLDGFTGALTGQPVYWPPELDPLRARPETILVMVTQDPHPFGGLDQRGGVFALRDADTAGSPLWALVAQIGTGEDRNVSPAGGRAAVYDVRALEFDLSAGSAGPRFLIEEGPARAAVSREAAAARAAAPAKLAVRIEDLVVHRSRAWLGADVRVDIVVATGPSGGGPDGENSNTPVHVARTERFSRIRGGEALPLDRMLVYHGPAVDYLDVAVWVSRDMTDRPDLADLLAAEPPGLPAAEALFGLGEAVAGVPHAAATAVVPEAGAVVVEAAYRLLRASLSDVIGLYRGSMLAQEGYGAGRHPVAGLRRVQDFSFAYRVELLG